MRVLSILAAILLATGASAQVIGNFCPPQGSCAAGVSNWDLNFCVSGTACPTPSTAARTCNNAFTIELTNFSQDGSLFTYEYVVCRIGGKADLSHWEFALGQIDCFLGGDGSCGLLGADGLPDPFGCYRQMIVGATLNGVPMGFTIGLDPTTQLVGLKIDLPLGTPGGFGTCNTFGFTLDASVLDPAWTLGVGCVLAATKAGNQDICRAGRLSPGYACIFGPVCVPNERMGTGCTRGYWGMAAIDGDTNCWPAPFTPTTPLFSVFTPPVGCTLDSSILNATLHDALGFSGGSGINGGSRILLGQAAAALLNAQATESVACTTANYPLTVAQVVGGVDAALASCNRDAMIALGADLDANNNLGCPQNSASAAEPCSCK